jgi:Carboxypeptidase regulatory-like domain/TonB dependent receptor
MRKRVHVAFACGLVLCVSGAVLAQNTNSVDIRGTVTDSSGAVMPGVTVTVKNDDTGVSKNFITNGEGLYDTVSSLPGTYTLTFSKAGFQKTVHGPVSLLVGVVTLNGVLEVGSATQEVVVRSDVQQMHTENPEVSTTLTTTALAALPNVTPNWQNFLKILPGASGTAASNAGVSNPGVAMAINGTLPYYSSYLIDGGTIRLPHSANIDSQIPESIAEVNVVATSFSAQYGSGGNVFNLISKTGSSQWHGVAYEYFQNDALNARDYFNSGAKARVRFNNFGGSFSGPILKDKLFFYFDYDQIVNPTQSTKISTVPTDAMKQGYFDPAVFGIITDPTTGKPFPGNQIPAGRFDPVAVAIQKFYREPNIPGLVNNNYRYLQTGSNPSRMEFGRLDYNMTDKNRINFTILEHTTPGHGTFNTMAPIDTQQNSGEGYSAQVSDVYTFNPKIVNELRYSWVRGGNWFIPGSLNKNYPSQLGLQYSKVNMFPNIQINGVGGVNAVGSSNGALNPQTNAIYIQNAFDLSDVVTMVRGKHILHFGADILFEQDNSTPWGNLNGATLTFSGQYSSPNANVGYADFLLGDVQAWSALDQGSEGMRSKLPAVFVQDDIKLRPNLTVNAGLRWEIHGGFSEQNNKAGSFDPTIINPITHTPGAIWFAGNNGRTQAIATAYDNVLPRFGIAWSPTADWTVRGGVGQYATLWSMDVDGSPIGFGSASTGSISANPGQAPVVQLSGSGTNLPYIIGPNRNPGGYNGQGGGNIPYMPYHTPVGKIWQWSVGVERRLPLNMTGEAAYVGSHGYGLQFQADINQVPANKLGGGQAARPYPQYLGIGPSVPGALTGLYNNISNYNALQLSLRKQLGYGLLADINFTWSKMMDDQDTSGWGSHYGNAYYQDAYNPSANYGPSNFNTPKMFKGYFVYELPVGNGHQLLNHGIGAAVLGGWKASSMFIAQSGTPFTPIMSSATNSGALDGNWFPNLVGNPHVSHQSINEWFNQLAYATPANNTFGTTRRNSLYGPDFTDIDLSVGKTFAIPGWESAHFEIRVDATNFVNHPSFNAPNNQLSAAALASGIANPSVGQITSTTNTGRTMQAYGRFSF